MAITCDWCNLSIHRRDVALSLTKMKWGIPWNSRQEEVKCFHQESYDAFWERDGHIENQGGFGEGEDYKIEYLMNIGAIGNYGEWYGLNKGPQLGLFNPKYVSISISDVGDCYSRPDLSASDWLAEKLEVQLENHKRYSSSGETVVAPSGDFCEECFEEIVHQCIESSARAKPPFDRGGWMGFTSKYIFTGDMKQPPLMIAVGAAKLDCIDCEDEFHSLHVVYISGNNGYEGRIEEDYNDDGDWQPTGERWTTDDLKLGRGPMVDYIRRGTWNSWIFNTIDSQGFEKDINIRWRNFDGFLTKKGWICYNCDD